MSTESEERIASIRAEVSAVRNWHHTMELAPGVVTAGRYDPRGLLDRLALPESLAGKRVLDIGTRDGFFAFEAARRGADVLAVDYCPEDSMGFAVAKRILRARVPFLHSNIYDLLPAELGTFDIVLCLGLVYHLPDPYLAFETVAGLTRKGGTAYVESNCLDKGFRDVHGAEQSFPAEWSGYPLALFTRANITNYWCMNQKCLEKLAGDVGFAVTRTETWGNRILLELTASDDHEAQRGIELARGLSENGL